jgi:putative Ca2+/H+ antiporter (TMEM165/GDT1 family)
MEGLGSLFAAMGLVFVAELGDKTQLVALGFGARHRLAPVLVGISVAYALVNLFSVVVGGALGAALPTRAINIGGGLLFCGFAVWTWRGDTEDVGGEPDAEQQGGPVPEGRAPASARAVVLSVAGAMIVAELGDKTMLATATLAAKGNPVLVWMGATIGIIASGALGVLVGSTVGARLSERVTRIGAAVLFAVFGVALLISAW